MRADSSSSARSFSPSASASVMHDSSSRPGPGSRSERHRGIRDVTRAPRDHVDMGVIDRLPSRDPASFALFAVHSVLSRTAPDRPPGLA